MKLSGIEVVAFCVVLQVAVSGVQVVFWTPVLALQIILRCGSLSTSVCDCTHRVYAACYSVVLFSPVQKGAVESLGISNTTQYFAS